jgi:serine/threonine protein kinase
VRNFDIGQRLGGGAFGEVFVATDGKRRQYAIKRNLAGNSSDAELKAAEILSAAKAFDDCRFLVRVVGTVDDDGATGVAQNQPPFEPGRVLLLEACARSLQDDIATRSEPYSFDEVFSAFWQLATGLRRLHIAKLIHRDVAPRNILIATAPSGCSSVCAGCVFKITDLGTAEVAPDGKVRQAAVEVTTTHAPFDPVASHQVDAFALGVVMFEMMSLHVERLGSVTIRYNRDEDAKRENHSAYLALFRTSPAFGGSMASWFPSSCSCWIPNLELGSAAKRPSTSCDGFGGGVF